MISFVLCSSLLFFKFTDFANSSIIKDVSRTAVSVTSLVMLLLSVYPSTDDGILASLGLTYSLNEILINFPGVILAFILFCFESFKMSF